MDESNPSSSNSPRAEDWTSHSSATEGPVEHSRERSGSQETDDTFATTEDVGESDIEVIFGGGDGLEELEEDDHDDDDDDDDTTGYGASEDGILIELR